MTNPLQIMKRVRQMYILAKKPFLINDLEHLLFFTTCRNL